MKITFTADAGPMYLTGWSPYEAGSRADLRHGGELVALGFAREGWGPAPAPVAVPEPEPTPEPEPVKPAPKRALRRKKS